MNIMVEYKTKEVDIAIVQCPKCESWFNVTDIADSPIETEADFPKVMKKQVIYVTP